MTQHINSKLVESKQRQIVEGDFFRYLGVRRAMPSHDVNHCERIGKERSKKDSSANFEGKYCHDGMPRKTKIPMQPEVVRAELKATADCDSGVMFGLDLMEGAERQNMKAY
ncbi:LOW QUALITY PROTEIN: Hypothetical protein PHPALM_20220 [Phytophthora palmivora]|uniref:Uncharacterized protein n=1 Tax=Phytophthora palmivora TaxID=4796 RepID=A0A2P4XFD8_9STRA|nr:LOW QUALITY PROTEIN: Hypothetical protein PHPALM_20220 [Phytophthora palmivora]